MVLFDIQQGSITQEPYTEEDYALTYNLLKANKTLLEVKQLTGKKGLYTKVKNEIQRIENEILSKIKGTYLLTAEEFHYDDDTGEKVIDTEAEYYKLTTKTALIESISSDILDVETVCDDLEDYYGTYEEGRTFTAFKDLVLANNE